MILRGEGGGGFWGFNIKHLLLQTIHILTIDGSIDIILWSDIKQFNWHQVICYEHMKKKKIIGRRNMSIMHIKWKMNFLANVFFVTSWPGLDFTMVYQLFCHSYLKDIIEDKTGFIYLPF